MIQLMVNMIAADPSLEIKAAARTIAEGWEGPLERHVERLRRRFRELKNEGKLPPPEDESSRLKRRVDEIRGLYSTRDRHTAKAIKDLEDAQRRAELIGLNHAHPLASLRELESVRDRVEMLARSSTDVAFAILLEQGITDPEIAAERVTEAATVYRKTGEAIELLREIRNLRAALKIPLT